MNTNKRMTAIVLAIVIAGASLAACAAHQANTDIDILETTTAGEETTTVPETTAGLTVTNNTATEPVTTTKPKPTTTTTKPAPSTPTKAQIDKIVSDARAYGESLGMGWNSSLTIDNSGWSAPATTEYQSLQGVKDKVYYQIKKWASRIECDGSPAFKVVSKKLSDGNYEIYVLRG